MRYKLQNNFNKLCIIITYYKDVFQQNGDESIIRNLIQNHIVRDKNIFIYLYNQLVYQVTIQRI